MFFSFLRAMMDLYWQYFLAGLLVYICARLMYFNFSSNTQGENEYQLGEYFKLHEDGFGSLDEAEFSTEEEEETAAANITLTHVKLPLCDAIRRSKEFYNVMNERRSVKYFRSEMVPIEIIHNVIKTAGTAPSCDHTEPWTYVLVKSQEMKEKIRNIVESQEEENCKKRMNSALRKEYLTEAPYLIVVFTQTHCIRLNGKKKLNQFSEHSVALSIGILLAAIQYAGLTSLTSTPSNCDESLQILLGRPPNEKFTLIVSVGYPSENCEVPDLQRKPLEEMYVEF